MLPAFKIASITNTRYSGKALAANTNMGISPGALATKFLLLYLHLLSTSLIEVLRIEIALVSVLRFSITEQA
jgi:hypothetical protein